VKPRKMKDSGIPWIGQIPEEWDIRRLKRASNLVVEKWSSRGDEESDGLPYLGLEHVESQFGRLVSDYRPILDFAGDTIRFRKGNVLFGKLRPYLAKCWFSDIDGKCSSEFFVMSPQDSFFGKYLQWTMLSNGFIDLVDGSTFGVKMPRAEWNFVGNIQIPCPKYEEQSRIAAYLDEKCGEIDRVIVAKERQNELLRDQRTAIISEAVTKGLNPNAKFKDSGFEWLGEIPVDWCHLPLRYAVVSITGGATPQKENPLFWDGDIPWASSKDLKTNKIYKTEDSITKEGLERCSVSLIDAGRLILCARSGILRHTLPACVNMVPLTINQDLKALEFRKEINIYYVQYYFLGLNREILTFSQKEGATVESLNMELLMKLPIFFPRMPEQEKIVSYLDSRCAEIDQVIAANEKMVAKLKEYRSSLIWEAVTGKTSL